MSYYSIGNSNAIGGGSLAKTENLPSLKLRCLDLCARHLDRLGDLGDMPTEMFIDLLHRAKERATPNIVQRLQDENMRLMCKDVDSAFWKQSVDGHILRRTLQAPGPVLVERTNEQKEVLCELKQTPPEGRSGSWARDVLAVLKALEEIPASVGLLQQTLIGKVVAPFRKVPNTNVASAASALVTRWKEGAALAKRIQEQQMLLLHNGEINNSAHPPAGGAAQQQQQSSVKSGKGGGKGGAATSPGAGAGGVGGERNPAEEKQRYVEQGFQCRTWHTLYWLLELMREEKVRISSKRAREARELELKKKPKMIMGKSKGEDLQRRLDAKAGRRSRMSMAFFDPTTSSSSSSSSSTCSSAGSSGHYGDRYGEGHGVALVKASSSEDGGNSKVRSDGKGFFSCGRRKRGSGGGAGGIGVDVAGKIRASGADKSSAGVVRTSSAGAGRSSSGAGRSSSSAGKSSSSAGRSSNSMKELRQAVMIGQRLSKPMLAPGKREPGSVGMTPLAKKGKFWK